MDGKSAQPPPLSNEELQTVLHTYLTAEAIKLRNPDKESWFRSLIKYSATPLITAAGIVLGSLLTLYTQASLKTKEINQLKEQKIIEKREEATINAHDLLGATLVAAENLIKFEKDSINVITKDKEKEKLLYEKFQEGEQKWNAEKKKIFLLLGYYYKNNEDVKRKWEAIEADVTAYFDAANLYFKFPEERCLKCEEAKNKLDADINNFGDAVMAASGESENTKK